MSTSGGYPRRSTGYPGAYPASPISPASPGSYQGPYQASSGTATPLRVSRSSLNQGSVSGDPAALAPIDIDAALINPASTTPSASQEAQPPTPVETTALRLPGNQGPLGASTGPQPSGAAGLSGKFKGGLDKMKGLFKRNARPPPPPGGIEDDDDTMGSQEFLDKIDTSAGITEDEKQGIQKTIAKIQTFFKRNQQMANPSLYQPGDIMILKEPKPKSKITFGNFINVMLIVFIVAGLIMCACIGVEPALYYLGPAFLGLGIFALVGKLFFSMLWQDDPLPSPVKSWVALYEKYLGGVPDPYGHKKYGDFTTSGSASRRPPLTTYAGPLSAGSKSDVTQLETFGYPHGGSGAATPKMQPSPVPSSNHSYSDARLEPTGTDQPDTHTTAFASQAARLSSAGQQPYTSAFSAQNQPYTSAPQTQAYTSAFAFGSQPYTSAPQSQPTGQSYLSAFAGAQAPITGTSQQSKSAVKLPAAWR